VRRFIVNFQSAITSVPANGCRNSQYKIQEHFALTEILQSLFGSLKLCLRVTTRPPVGWPSVISRELST